MTDVVHEHELDLYLNALQAVKPDASVLLVTSLPAGRVLMREGHRVRTGLLHKPFEPDQLERALHGLLGG